MATLNRNIWSSVDRFAKHWDIIKDQKRPKKDSHPYHTSKKEWGSLISYHGMSKEWGQGFINRMIENERKTDTLVVESMRDNLSPKGKTKRQIRNINKKAAREQYAKDFKEHVELGTISIPLTKPKEKSEFEVQAALFSILKAYGYDVHGEVPHKVGGSSTARFDLVIFNPNGKNIIIEVKNGKKKRDSTEIKKQIRKYSIFDAELLFCIGEEQIDQVVSDVDRIMEN